MLGRRLDRYVAAFFLWHFLLSLVAILGLYVIIDTFAKLADFVEREGLLEQLRWIAIYHAYQLPVLLSQFLPVVTLLAGIIALARLSRYNELNAMKAAGVSIHRTILPLLLTALVIGALGAADQELLVPYLEPDIRAVDVEVRRTKEFYRDLYVFDARSETTVWVRRLDSALAGHAIGRVEAVPSSPSGSAAPSLRCDHAVWAARWLFLFDGALLPPEGQPRPFTYKTLLADSDAAGVDPRADQPARLADGTPAHRIGASLDGKPVEVRFATCERKATLRLIRGAQITAPPKGGESAVPIFIQAALWHDGQWLGRAQSYQQVSPRRRVEILYDGEPIPLNATPTELIKKSADPTLKSFGELLEMGRRDPTLRQKILVVLHGRVAFPLASFVLLLVAIPFLFQQEGGKSTWMGVGLALLVSVCFYFTNYTCQIVGQTPEGIFEGAPAAAAWLPIVLFTLAGLMLTANMDT